MRASNSQQPTTGCVMNCHLHRLAPKSVAMRRARRRNLEWLGQWVVDDLVLQTREYPASADVVFCCASTMQADRQTAIAAMYVRAIEQAERLGVLPGMWSNAIRVWLRTGEFKRA